MIRVAIEVEIHKRLQALLLDIEMVSFFGSWVHYSKVEGIFLGKYTVKQFVVFGTLSVDFDEIHHPRRVIRDAGDVFQRVANHLEFAIAFVAEFFESLGLVGWPRLVQSTNGLHLDEI